MSTILSEEGRRRSDAVGGRRPYVRPRLRCLGDVRDVTLGPSLGTGESGQPSSYRSGTGGLQQPPWLSASGSP